MKDVNTDRPEYIKVLYAFEPRLLTDPPKYGNRLEFTSEVIETFGKYIWLFATNVGTKQHIYAKEHYVPLFA